MTEKTRAYGGKTAEELLALHNESGDWTPGVSQLLFVPYTALCTMRSATPDLLDRIAELETALGSATVEGFERESRIAELEAESARKDEVMRQMAEALIKREEEHGE